MNNKRKKILLTTLVVTVLMTACGAGDDSNEQADDPAPSNSAPSSSTASPSPEYVETETCRTAMAPLVDVMLANKEDSLEFNVFDNRVQQLQEGIDAALAPCSSEVSDPAREVMYNFIAANTRWSVCDSKTCIKDITKFIQDGLRKAEVVEFKVNLQT